MVIRKIGDQPTNPVAPRIIDFMKPEEDICEVSLRIVVEMPADRTASNALRHSLTNATPNGNNVWICEESVQSALDLGRACADRDRTRISVPVWGVRPLNISQRKRHRTPTESQRVARMLEDPGGIDGHGSRVTNIGIRNELFRSTSKAEGDAFGQFRTATLAPHGHSFGTNVR
ncbi:MAG: hypothetical protein M3464_19390 [Chloroflexota bacterium]|nr:hypothetical protein [Chloroflexota bacterium]